MTILGCSKDNQLYTVPLDSFCLLTPCLSDVRQKIPFRALPLSVLNSLVRELNVAGNATEHSYMNIGEAAWTGADTGRSSLAGVS